MCVSITIYVYVMNVYLLHSKLVHLLIISFSSKLYKMHNHSVLKEKQSMYIVDTPNFVSSYRLQPVVNDSDLLSGRDFAPLTHRRHRIS